MLKRYKFSPSNWKQQYIYIYKFLLEKSSTVEGKKITKGKRGTLHRRYAVSWRNFAPRERTRLTPRARAPVK